MKTYTIKPLEFSGASGVMRAETLIGNYAIHDGSPGYRATLEVSGQKSRLLGYFSTYDEAFRRAQDVHYRAVSTLLQETDGERYSEQVVKHLMERAHMGGQFNEGEGNTPELPKAEKYSDRLLYEYRTAQQPKLGAKS